MWYNRFKKDREDTNDDARLGHASTPATDENIEATKQMILNNRRVIIREAPIEEKLFATIEEIKEKSKQERYQKARFKIVSGIIKKPWH